MGDGLEPITVIVCEDTHDYLSVFEHEEAAGHGGQRPVILFGDPRTYGAEAVADILSSHPHGPDVLLVDDVVPYELGGPLHRNAVRIAAEITKRIGENRPRCVLWTAQPDEPALDRFAFLAYGGHHFAAKNSPNGLAIETLRTIREAADGRRWPLPRPKPISRERDETIRKHLDVLALAHDGLTPAEIAEELGYQEKTILGQLTELGGALGQPTFADTGKYSASGPRPRLALELGYRWVPQRYWRYFPGTESWRPAGPMRLKRRGE